MNEVTHAAFDDELGKIAKKVTMYAFKDPVSYRERAKARTGVRKGMEEHGKAIRTGTGLGAGGGAAVGGAGGALAGYLGGRKKALPAILGGLAGAAAGGLGGYFGGRALGREAGKKKLKKRGVTTKTFKVTPKTLAAYPQVKKVLQRAGYDVWAHGPKPAYSKEDLAKIQKGILSRVGAPDPSVLRSLGLPTLK